jgi:hypothetical protein
MSFWTDIESPFKRLNAEAARIGNQAYDNSLGSLGGWFGKHVWGQGGVLADYTRGLNTMSTGGATGFGPVGMLAAQDEGYRQKGSTPGRALAQTGTMQGESLLAMLAALGGAGAAAAGTGGSAGAGTGGAVGAYGSGEGAATAGLSAPGVGSGVEGGFTVGGDTFDAAGNLISPASSGGSSGFSSIMNYIRQANAAKGLLGGGQSSGSGSSRAAPPQAPQAATTDNTEADPEAGLDIIQQLLSNPTVISQLQQKAWAQPRR